MFNFFGNYNQQPTSFKNQFQCYPVAFRGKENLENGDKIILPSSALAILTRMSIQWPVLFEVSNPLNRKFTHSGVQEFDAEEGVCYMPYWMMDYLKIKEGGYVTISQKELVKGTFVKIQPHSKTFLDIHNPQAVLEKHLRNFSAMTKGQEFAFKYNDSNYKFNVLEVKPANAVSIIETDINVDFAPPLDYEEPKPIPKENNNNKNLLVNSPKIVPVNEDNLDDSDDDFDSDASSEEDTIKFPGSGQKLSQKNITLNNNNNSNTNKDDKKNKKSNGGLLLGSSSGSVPNDKNSKSNDNENRNFIAFSGEGYTLKKKK
eukprot:TRINITY_DN10143_c0_g1_i1.p1 TRINITY_DN10143_c0_g1~~TRINITY_DN10143_c0_g1_i1.p1  ORF type:complete len:316 (-),score=88.42 TRINITY_DN10143_c0_g1_i1:10-957(-)